MHTKQLTSILLVFLCIFCFTSCNHDDVNFPTFTFNENGECEPASVTPHFFRPLRRSRSGYAGSTSTPTKSIPTALARRRITYQDLTGAGPTQYYMESNSSLKKYMYIDAYPAWGIPDSHLYLLGWKPTAQQPEHSVPDTFCERQHNGNT